MKKKLWLVAFGAAGDCAVWVAMWRSNHAPVELAAAAAVWVPCGDVLAGAGAAGADEDSVWWAWNGRQERRWAAAMEPKEVGQDDAGRTGEVPRALSGMVWARAGGGDAGGGGVGRCRGWSFADPTLGTKTKTCQGWGTRQVSKSAGQRVSRTRLESKARLGHGAMSASCPCFLKGCWSWARVPE